MSDFGAILKGQDYLDNDTIKRNNFYATLMSIQSISHPETGIKEGDIMDLMNKYDPQNTQFISLYRIKSSFDTYIRDQRYWIVLESKVKEICDENILEDDNETTQGSIMVNAQ